MSKRYGRNQRRKNGERIVQLENAHHRGIELLKLQSAKIGEAMDTINGMIRAIESVCRYSSVIPAKEIEGSYDMDEYRIIQQQLAPNFVDSQLQACKITETYVDTYALKTYLQDHHNEFTKSVHLIYNGKRQAYMLSEHALMTMDKNEIAKYLLPRIFNDLIRELKKQIAA